jgi:hypothetical protein
VIDGAPGEGPVGPPEAYNPEDFQEPAPP